MSKRHLDFVLELAELGQDTVCDPLQDWLQALPDSLSYAEAWKRADWNGRAWMRRVVRRIRRRGLETAALRAAIESIPTLRETDPQMAFMRALKGTCDKRDLKRLHDADRWTLKALKAQLGAP